MLLKRKSWAVSASMTLFALAAVLSAREQKAAIGEVIQMQGRWRIAGESATLSLGEGVPAGASIETISKGKPDFIVVVLLNGRRLAVSCAKDPCEEVLKIPEAYVESSVSIQKIVDAIRLVLLNRRVEVANAYVSASSRGPRYTRFELVLPFESAGGLSIAPALGGLPEGDYHLEVRRVADRHFVTSQEMHWDKTSPVPVEFPEPGFYVATLDDRTQKFSADIFLAISAPDSYGPMKSALENARALTAGWSDPDAESSAHLIVRAYLLAQADKR